MKSRLVMSRAVRRLQTLHRASLQPASTILDIYYKGVYWGDIGIMEKKMETTV